MPLPIIIWLWWSSVLGVPSWQQKAPDIDQKSA